MVVVRDGVVDDPPDEPRHGQAQDLRDDREHARQRRARAGRAPSRRTVAAGLRWFAGAPRFNAGGASIHSWAGRRARCRRSPFERRPGRRARPGRARRRCRRRRGSPRAPAATARRMAGVRAVVSGSIVIITQRASRWSTRIARPPIRSTEPTQASSGNGSSEAGSTSRFGRKRSGTSSLPTRAPRSRQRARRDQRERHRVEDAASLLDHAGARPELVRELLRRSPRARGRRACGPSHASRRVARARRTRARSAHISGRSRIVSQGKPLRGMSGCTNAQRRSPASPCHETSTASSGSAAMDFTG